MSEFTALTMRIMVRQLAVPPTEQELADATDVIESWIEHGRRSFLFMELYEAACPPVTIGALIRVLDTMVKSGRLRCGCLDDEEYQVRYEVEEPELPVTEEG